MTTLDQTYTVLVVDDEADLRTLYQTALQRAGYTVLCADNVSAAITCLQTNTDIACVVTDYRLPDATGIDLAQHIAQKHTGLPVAMMTAYGSPDHAVQALKAGAFDYLSKPVSIANLRSTVAQMLAQSRLRQHNDPAALIAQLTHLLPGQSPAMQQVFQAMAQFSQSLACVAIDGQQGTGKELASRAIHSCSVRSSQAFIVFNCAAHSANNAHSDSLQTAFQTAQGGTLLLEAIEMLPQHAQLELLHILQNRSIKPVSADKTIPVDVRLMVSSEAPLSQTLAAGRLRQDLFYRLHILTLSLPPLHEREGDAAWLAQRWLAQHPQGKSLTLSTAAIKRLNTHCFAGNVRELENALERSVALASGQSSVVLEIDLLSAQNSLSTSATAMGNAVNNDAKQGGTESPKPVSSIVFPVDLITHLASIERDIIEQALQGSRYNRTQAATALGLNLRQLRYRMEQLGIKD